MDKLTDLIENLRSKLSEHIRVDRGSDDQIYIEYRGDAEIDLFAEVQRGIDRVAGEVGYQISVCETAQNPLVLVDFGLEPD